MDKNMQHAGEQLRVRILACMTTKRVQIFLLVLKVGQVHQIYIISTARPRQANNEQQHNLKYLEDILASVTWHWNCMLSAEIIRITICNITKVVMSNWQNDVCNSTRAMSATAQEQCLQQRRKNVYNRARNKFVCAFLDQIGWDKVLCVWVGWAGKKVTQFAFTDVCILHESFLEQPTSNEKSDHLLRPTQTQSTWMECRQNTFQATNTVSHMRITCHVCAIFTYIYAHIHIHIYWIKNAFQAFAQVHCRQPLCSLCSIDYVLGNDISGVIEGPDQRRKQAQDKSCMYVFLHVSIHT